jgi:hypothetical protein
MIFKNIFAKIFSEIIGFFVSKQSEIMQKFDHIIVFQKNVNFFAKKLSKIAENRDHNIDPRTEDRGFETRPGNKVVSRLRYKLNMLIVQTLKNPKKTLKNPKKTLKT